MVSDVNCSEGMDRASHYRDQAKHARCLADAAWQLDLRETLRCIAKDYDRDAEEIETAATQPRTHGIQQSASPSPRGSAP